MGLDRPRGPPGGQTRADEPIVYSYDDEENDAYETYIPVKQRKVQALAKLHRRSQGVVRNEAPVEAPPRPVQSLLQEARALREREKEHGTHASQAEKEAEEERQILEAHASRKKLVSHAELAHGVQYAEPITRSWTPPHFVRARTESENVALRQQHHVLVEGERIPPLIAHFRDMKIPTCILAYLARKNIHTPSPIQMQGLPTAFSGRDMIGIAFTGSGKTLTFSLPLLLFAAEAERRLAFDASDGPLGIILCPSRELARQTYESIQAMAAVMEEGGYARVSALLCIGGISMAEQASVLRSGFHIVVATPGRLQDMLEQKKFPMDACTYLCMDEADRMIDGNFEENVRNIMSAFTVCS